MSSHQAQPQETEQAARWLLAEYEITDVDEDIRLAARVAVQPMITFKSPYSASPMTVRNADYDDPDRWWL